MCVGFLYASLCFEPLYSGVPLSPPSPTSRGRVFNGLRFLRHGNLSIPSSTLQYQPIHYALDRRPELGNFGSHRGGERAGRASGGWLEAAAHYCSVQLERGGAGDGGKHSMGRGKCRGEILIPVCSFFTTLRFWASSCFVLNLTEHRTSMVHVGAMCIDVQVWLAMTHESVQKSGPKYKGAKN